MAESTFAGSSFVTISVPDLTWDDYLVVICTVPQTYCTRDALAYHVADLAAFKHLFTNRLPSSHHLVWLSACHPRPLGSLHHGSKEVISAFDDSIQIETDQAELMGLFLSSITVSGDSIRTKEQSTSSRLIVIVCGPTNSQQDILAHIPRSLDPQGWPGLSLCL